MNSKAEVPSGEFGMRSNDPFGRILFAMAKALALFGGLVLLVIVFINFLSIIGRYAF